MGRTTADIAYELLVGYFAAGNVVPAAEIPELLKSVHASVLEVYKEAKEYIVYDPATAPTPVAATSVAAASVETGPRKKVKGDPMSQKGNRPLEALLLPSEISRWEDTIKTIDGKQRIICLEDGKWQRMLERRLWEQWGLTPKEYVSRWEAVLGKVPEHMLVKRKPGDQKAYPMYPDDYVERQRKIADEMELGSDWNKVGLTPNERKDGEAHGLKPADYLKAKELGVTAAEYAAKYLNKDSAAE